MRRRDSCAKLGEGRGTDSSDRLRGLRHPVIPAISEGEGEGGERRNWGDPYFSEGTLLRLLFQLVRSHTFFLLGLTMVMNHMVNADLLSLPYPLLIFCYAILETPEPVSRPSLLTPLPSSPLPLPPSSALLSSFLFSPLPFPTPRSPPLFPLPFLCCRLLSSHFPTCPLLSPPPPLGSSLLPSGALLQCNGHPRQADLPAAALLWLPRLRASLRIRGRRLSRLLP